MPTSAAASDAPPREAKRLPRSGAGGAIGRLLPGLALSVGIAALTFALRKLPGVAAFSPMILAILLGIGFHNLIGLPARAKPGVAFALRRVLRLAIMLLGLQLTAQQIAGVGLLGVGLIAATLVATFIFTKGLGRVIGVEHKLAELIAAGTSICGASAVIAANVVTEADDEDVAYAVACVTLFGSIAMFAYPLLPGILHLGPRAYGLWSGASIQEIAQVVAASFQAGKEAGDYGTIAKLTRVGMLAPVVMTVGLLQARSRRLSGSARKPVPMPYFVLGFVALVICNSVVAIPAAPKGWIVLGTSFLLSLSLAAMGLETDLRKLRARGLRALLLGAISWLFIAGLSLALVEMAGLGTGTAFG
jgi:uncharacterized integral membrane protein (TIGR00698 family)